MELAMSDDETTFDEPVEQDPTHRYSRTEHVLGRGACKTVYKALDEDEGREVAWNRVHEFMTSKEERERLIAEIRVLNQLKHKNIMTFYDSWLDPKTQQINFITEMFTSGTLRQYRKRHKQVDGEVLKRWAWQILCGLVYLHGHTPAIIHRDLKCDNIFINGSEGVVKIGDLGLATMLRARTAPQSVLGTPEFMAPELYEEEYDDRVDVYSFGMCLLELAVLEYPYAECRNAAQIYRKVSLGIRPQGLQRVPCKELQAVISLCISPRADRPRARQLLKHPYFDTIRQEKGSVKLSVDALAVSGNTHSELAAEIVGDLPSGQDISRCSSAAAEPSAVLTAISEGSSESGADSPPAAMREPRMSQGELLSKPSYDISMPITGEREFRVTGRLSDDAPDTVNLRLRIQQQTGKTSAKTIAFDFDLSMDTADSVAGEMVDEMDLSAGDFASIASAIRAEVHMLTGTSTPHLGSMMHHAAPQLLQRLSMPSESTAPTSAPASSADMHDICSPMSVAALSGGQPVSAEDLAFHGSSPDENWAEGADPSLALAAAEGDGSVPGGSPDHRASLSRLLSPRKRSSSTLPHMKRMMSQEFGPLEEAAAQAAPAQLPLAPPSAVCAPMRGLPSTGFLPALQAASASPGPHQRLTPAASASLCHPSGAATPPPAARPGRVDLPPHRTHAVAREQLPSAFSAASKSPLPLATSYSSLLTMGRSASPVEEPQSRPAMDRAATDWPWASSRAAAEGSISAVQGPPEGPAAGSMLAGQQDSGSGGLCRRSAADKELRRKAAADTAMARMKNMEAQSLSGLDAFGLKGCMPGKSGKPGEASLLRTSMY